MSLKHAVLALVVERRGYGYDLVQRFEERVGPGWRLTPSAVYLALDQLERGGLVEGTPLQGGTRRSPRVAYAATRAGEAALEDWLRTPVPGPEPIRSELHLKVAFARPADQPTIAAQLAERVDACEALLARYAERPAPMSAARRLVDAAVVARLEAELAWLREAVDQPAAGTGTPARSATRAASAAIVGQRRP